MIINDYILKNSETGASATINGDIYTNFTVTNAAISKYSFTRRVEAATEGVDVQKLLAVFNENRNLTFDTVIIRSKYRDVEYNLRGPVTLMYEGGELVIPQVDVSNHGNVSEVDTAYFIEILSLKDTF